MISHVAWALVLVAGCTREADYATVRQRCDEPMEAWDPSQSMAEVVEILDRRCAAALGDSVGLDWESFGFEAGDPGASETGASVLVGLLTIAASEDGDLDQTLQDEHLPVILGEELERMADVHGFDESTPASEVWFEFVRQAVWTVRYAEEIDGLYADIAAASYVPYEQTMYVTPLSTGSEPMDRTPAAMGATTLLHEASHGWITPHTACPPPSEDSVCDATPEGAYGVQVWWTTDWIVRHSTRVDPSLCETLENYKRGACNGGIVDSEEWPPCERVCP